MEKIETIKTLLQKIGKIVDEDQKIQEERELKGEKFNLFNILGLWSDEVRLHSAFLAELLNPKGKHGLKSRFLQAFIEIINSSQKLKIDLDVDNVNVEVEVYIGKVDSKKAIGGRIDILISDGVNAIIIENKIYAGDSFQQLTRYYNYGIEKYKVDKEGEENFDILYLTLFGTDASEASAGKDKERVPYASISYYYDILRWLERCLEISVRHPLVRESINQYITLIKQLTNQNMENEIQNELIKIISNKNNFEAALKISGAIQSSKQKLYSNIFKDNLKAKLIDREAELISFHDNLFVKYKGGFEIRPKGWKNFKFQCAFDGNLAKGCIVGILKSNALANPNSVTAIREIAKNTPGYCSTLGWDILRWCKFKNWDNNVFIMMYDHDSLLYKEILGAIDEYIEMTKDLDM